ncbi:hypothetical protein Pden_0163 [Paracoccus denitrificans PD1222]|uniref:Uncharacterized protein n=1 Tax=Paracoccus denitrificans (strain Pd 1222) TaxID=318586 RepID=A1AYD6_PARDP|nr:hypothetical protein Pden_0163 [Paracoccus denitrificans PD1222]
MLCSVLRDEFPQGTVSAMMRSGSCLPGRDCSGMPCQLRCVNVSYLGDPLSIRFVCASYPRGMVSGSARVTPGSEAMYSHLPAGSFVRRAMMIVLVASPDMLAAASGSEPENLPQGENGDV